jgi:hypothetical protein
MMSFSIGLRLLILVKSIPCYRNDSTDFRKSDRKELRFMQFGPENLDLLRNSIPYDVSYALSEYSNLVIVAGVRVARIRQELTLFAWSGLQLGHTRVEAVLHFANPDFLY